MHHEGKKHAYLGHERLERKRVPAPAPAPAPGHCRCPCLRRIAARPPRGRFSHQGSSRDSRPRGAAVPMAWGLALADGAGRGEGGRGCGGGGHQRLELQRDL